MLSYNSTVSTYQRTLAAIECNIPRAVDTTRLRLVQPRLLTARVKAHNERADTERPDTTTLRIPLLHASHVLRDVLDRHRILHRQAMALRLQPRLVYQYPGVGVEAGEGEADVVVDHADLGGGNARVLQLHGGSLFAAEDDDAGAFDGDGAGAALDRFESVFDLKDVAIGGED